MNDLNDANDPDDVTTLPVADRRTTWRHIRELLRRHRGAVTVVTVVNLFAVLAGLVGPLALGRLVDAVRSGAGIEAVYPMLAAAVAAVLIQAGLTRLAAHRAMVLGETVFAQEREAFVEVVTHLPLSTVEAAGGGDLQTRTTRDIDNIQQAVRFGVPRLVVSIVTLVITATATVVVSPVVAVVAFVGTPATVLVARWFLRRAPGAYHRLSRAYTGLIGTVSESVEGARTVDALLLDRRRMSLGETALGDVYQAERAVLNLRTALMPAMDLNFVLVPVLVLAWGGLLVSEGTVTVGAVAAVVMLVHQMQGPAWELVSWLDEIQLAATSMARILGVRLVPGDRAESGETPDGERIVCSDVRFAYRPGVDVLRGIDLALRPGERLAVVGPSGSGKSTMGRILAGIHPATGGSASVGGVSLVDLPLTELRRNVVLVTQEHHVFVGSIADNLRLADPGATDDDLWDALRSVHAHEWVRSFDDGIGTQVGGGGHPLTAPQAQQLALARILLLDPHTLVLDEATSLLDPAAARHLEASLSAVLRGRTVVVIAHRLHTAHDADRVAVVDDGRVTELGSHADLVDAGGDYAALWRSWRPERPAAAESLSG